MTDKKFIALNLLVTVVGILILAFSNGIIYFGKKTKPELPHQPEPLVVPVQPLNVTQASACVTKKAAL